MNFYFTLFSFVYIVNNDAFSQKVSERDVNFMGKTVDDLGLDINQVKYPLKIDKQRNSFQYLFKCPYIYHYYYF